MGDEEVGAFLSFLAMDRNVAASTQNQALNALVFLYKAVLDKPLGKLQGVVRAKKPRRLPAVLSRNEVMQVLRNLQGHHWLAACLLYGSGLRLMECVRLRVKDLDFEHRAVIVREGKGGKDRVVTLPDELIVPLQRHLGSVRNVHEKDLAEGYGAVWLPHALARKYPQAPAQWGWQYIFPATRRSLDPRSNIIRRHHIDESQYSESGQGCYTEGWHRKTGKLPHIKTFLRHASAGTGHGYPYSTGATWTQGHSNDATVYAFTQTRR